MKRENALHMRALLARGKDPPATPIPAIDILKGFSMLFIWYVHFAWAWHDDSWTSLFRFSWYILDVIGPSMFIVLSVVGNMASYQATTMPGRKPGITRKKVFKASFLFIYGECINLFFLWHLGWFHLSGWNVITTIALFSLLLPYMLRLRPRTRLAIVVTIFIAYYPLAMWLTGYLASHGITPENLQIDVLMDPMVSIYWFFFCHGMMTPLFPWIAVPLLVSVIFERVVKAIASKQSDLVPRELKRLLLVGVLILAAGVLFGLYPMIDFNLGAMDELLTPGFYFTYPFHTGIVAFLVRHVPQYLCYNTGCAAILFSIISYLHVKMPGFNEVQSSVKSFGKLSLTAYLLSHLGLLIPLSLPIELFFSIFLPILIVTVLAFHAWVTRWNAFGSLEWLMGFTTNAAIFGIEYLEKQKQGRAPMKGLTDGEINNAPTCAT
nr:hypothetical protein [Candidatus Sigynarchaeum springense]